MDPLLQPFAGLVIPHSALTNILAAYRAPNFKIHRWLKDGHLWPLKRGLYAVNPHDSGSALSLPLIANQLYGPSYVSLEFALFQHRLIPERPVQITSVTPRRGKTCENIVGRFSYQRLPESYYALGIQYVKLNERVAYMMANREKALCDWLVLTPNLKVYSTGSLKTLLLEDMRVDQERLCDMDASKVALFANASVKPRLLLLLASLLGEI